MFLLSKIITAMLLPPFNVLILWLLALLLARLHYKKLSRLATLLGIVILYVFSTPYLSSVLNDALVEKDNMTLDDYRNAQAIVVLGEGVRDSTELSGKITTSALLLERMRYAAFLHKETQLPILVTGNSPNGTSVANVMAKELESYFHTPTKWIESQAKTTKENAQLTKAMLEKEQIQKIVLVTNEWHMKRAKMLFEQQGFEVLPASVGTGTTPDGYRANIMYFVPQVGAMQSSTAALREWLGYWKEKQ